MSIETISQPLIERPNLQFLKHVAKDLLRAVRRGEPDAITRIGNLGRQPILADAQRTLANEHGFRSWNDFRDAIIAQSGTADGSTGRRADRSAKHEQPSTITAAGFMAAAQASGWKPERLPDVMVFVFQGHFSRELEEADGFSEAPDLAPGNGRVFLSTDRSRTLGISCLSPGATTMIGQVENQMALDGADTFVAYNLAGGIGPAIEPGDISVITSAIRDDGVSDHYLPPADSVDADSELVAQLYDGLRATFPRCEQRVAWTNPAIFRQTEAELQHYATNGVDLVESETAALFAVAEALGTRAGSVLVPTSVWNDGESHNPEPGHKIPQVLKDGFWTLLDTLAPR